MKEINFLSERRKQLTKQERLDRRTLIGCSIFFGVVLIVFMCILGYRLFLSHQLNQRLAAEKLARSRISSNEQLERSFVVFANKLSALAGLYQGKQDKKEVIQYFDQLMNDRALIKKIDFDQKQQLLVFRVQSEDVFRLQQVLDAVNSEEVQGKFQSIAATDLRRTADGKYEISVTVLAENNKL